MSLAASAGADSEALSVARASPEGDDPRPARAPTVAEATSRPVCRHRAPVRASRPKASRPRDTTLSRRPDRHLPKQMGRATRPGPKHHPRQRRPEGARRVVWPSRRASRQAVAPEIERRGGRPCRRPKATSRSRVRRPPRPKARPAPVSSCNHDRQGPEGPRRWRPNRLAHTGDAQPRCTRGDGPRAARCKSCSRCVSSCPPSHRGPARANPGDLPTTRPTVCARPTPRGPPGRHPRTAPANRGECGRGAGAGRSRRTESSDPRPRYARRPEGRRAEATRRSAPPQSDDCGAPRQSGTAAQDEPASRSPTHGASGDRSRQMGKGRHHAVGTGRTPKRAQAPG